MNKVLGYIELAKEEGGTVLCGGRRIHLDGELANGWYIEPTIIEGLDATLSDKYRGDLRARGNHHAL